jgi:O-antigen ligase
MKLGNIIIYLLVFIYPFTLMIDYFLAIKIANISIMNCLYTVFYCYLTLNIFIKMFKLRFKFSKIFWVNLYLILFFYFILLVKFYEVGSLNDVIQWLLDNNYYFSMFVLGIYIYLSNINIKVLVKTVYISSFIVTLIGLYSFFSDNYFGMVDYNVLLNYSIIGTDFTRFMSVFANPNVAAYYYLIILTFLTRNIKTMLQEFNKPLLIIYYIFSITSFVLTFSRSAFFAFLLILSVYILKNLIRGNLVKNFLFFSFLTTVVISLFSFNINNIYFFDKNYILNDPRLLKWKAGLEFFWENPMIGTKITTYLSLGTWQTTFYDNEFLKSLIRFGVLGFIPLICLFLFYSYNVMNLMKKQLPLGITALYMNLIFLYGCFFNNFLEFFPVNIYFLIFVVVLFAKSNKNFAPN